MDAGGFYRAIVKMEDQHVRIGSVDFLDGSSEDILVEIVQSESLATSQAKPVTADIFGVTIFLAKFAEAIPMFLQAVMSIRLCQTFDKIPTAFAANDLG